MATARSDKLRALAQRVADALPPGVIEVVLTGSVSRGVADEVSDIEMLVVWWSRELAEELFAGGGSAEPLTNGVPLRTSGLLARWQHRLADYPDAVIAEQIEKATERWGGYAPPALLTIARPDSSLTRMDAQRVLTIVFALNRVHPPTAKRLAARVEPLALKPERLAERIDEALAERDPLCALLTIAELQLETVQLAPSGPNVDRARIWLAEAMETLR